MTIYTFRIPALLHFDVQTDNREAAEQEAAKVVGQLVNEGMTSDQLLALTTGGYLVVETENQEEVILADEYTP